MQGLRKAHNFRIFNYIDRKGDANANHFHKKFQKKIPPAIFVIASGIFYIVLCALHNRFFSA